MPRALAAALVTLAALTACAGSVPPAAPPARAAEEEAVRTLQWEWLAALERGDVAAVERIVAPDYVTTAADGNVLTRAQDLETLASGDLRFDKAGLEQLHVRVFGDSAVTTGIAFFVGSVRGRRFEGRERFTDTWVKRGGRWVAVASHNSRLPQTQPAAPASTKNPQ
jgi:hypothetical protein